MALSPEGERLAFIKTLEDGQRVVVVISLAGRNVVGTVRAGESKVRTIEWIDDDHILIVTSTTAVPINVAGGRGEWAMLQVYDVAQHRVRGLMNGNVSGSMNVMLGNPMVRRVLGRMTLFVVGLYGEGRLLTPSLFRIDVETGDETVVAKGSIGSREWLVGEDGAVLVARRYDEAAGRFALVTWVGGTMRTVAEGPDLFGEARLVGLSSTGGAIVVQVPEDGDTVWRELSLADWRLSAPIAHGRMTPLLERMSDRLVGEILAADETVRFVDGSLQEWWNGITPRLGGRAIPVSLSDDHTRMVAGVDSPISGAAFALVHKGDAKIVPVGQVYEGLPPLGEVRKIDYAARDGLRIPAYLTAPYGREATNLPLVVLPHGGPAVADSGGFDWWAQALAAEGYAVLQPNFRGSTTNTTMMAAGFGEWGRKMQTDLSDGVRFLAAKHIIDPARVAIVGASYGGYAALAGVSLEQGVYRCAASVGGLSDPKRFLRARNADGGRYVQSTIRWWDRFMGDAGPEISPLAHAASVSVPVLLIHGRDDTVVPYEQSQLMGEALRRLEKPVDLVPLDREDHWLSRASTRTQMLSHVVAFLHRCNPSD